MADKDKVKVFFLRNKYRFPVACVALTEVEEGEVSFAVSTYNPRDPFNKSLAKHVALNRLTYGGEFTGVVPAGDDIKSNVLSYIIEAVSQSQLEYAFPQRAREAAQLWFKICETRRVEAAKKAAESGTTPSEKEAEA